MAWKKKTAIIASRDIGERRERALHLPQGPKDEGCFLPLDGKEGGQLIFPATGRDSVVLFRKVF